MLRINPAYPKRSSIFWILVATVLVWAVPQAIMGIYITGMFGWLHWMAFGIGTEQLSPETYSIVMSDMQLGRFSLTFFVIISLLLSMFLLITRRYKKGIALLFLAVCIEFILMISTIFNEENHVFSNLDVAIYYGLSYLVLCLLITMSLRYHRQHPILN